MKKRGKQDLADHPERIEGEILGMMARARSEMPSEEFEEFSIAFLMMIEPDVRKMAPADHPALVMLDEYRERREMMGS